MGIRRWFCGTGFVIAVSTASLALAPAASARVHIGVGIAIPGIRIGVGNCWRCGYWAPPPAYYRPVYPAPVYYPAAPYYVPPPVYYGYGYRYYPRPYRRGGWHAGRGHYRWHGMRGNRGAYYHRRHR